MALFGPDSTYSGSNGFTSQLFGLGAYDPTNQDRTALQQNAGQSNALGAQFGNNYQGNQAGINNTAGMLQSLANGNNSVSAMQLQQGLQQSQGQQMSMAASATPQNQAMAARNAMMNSGNAASGMMGQQAMAGVQERQGALNALSQLQLQQSQQNMQGALGMYGNANQGYGTTIQYPQKGMGSMFGGAFGGMAGAAAA